MATATLRLEARGRNSIGWFVDKNKLTTYYNIIYPKSFTNDIYNLDSIEAFLLNSKELQEAVFPEIQKHKIHFDNIEEFMLNQSSYKGRRYFCHQSIYEISI